MGSPLTGFGFDMVALGGWDQCLACTVVSSSEFVGVSSACLCFVFALKWFRRRRKSSRDVAGLAPFLATRACSLPGWDIDSNRLSRLRTKDK